MQDHEIRLNVADLVVSLRSDPGVRVVGHVDSFLTHGPPEAAIKIRFGNEADWAGEWHQLSTGQDLGWNAFRTTDGESILVERLGGDVLVRFAPDVDCRFVEVLLKPSGQAAASNRLPGRDLLLVEIMPLPVVVLLSGRGGLFIHSCAVALKGEGILFAGVSGSGKSTMAELWRRFGPSSSRVIDDEHILARSSTELTMLFGAPWSRGARKATFSRTPAKAIFFLSHGDRNQCTHLSSGEALAQLMSQVFLPVWSQEQLERTLQTCAGLLENIECYGLQFVPDAEGVGFVQDVLGGLQ
jgi:hypothetical protein